MTVLREDNAVIASLPRKEGRRFAGLCGQDELVPGTVLCESNQPFQKAYFPTAGVISVMSILTDRPPLELGLIGRDGMLGATLSLGVLMAPMQAVVQEAGTALVMNVAQIRTELRNSPRLTAALHRYQFRLMMQLLQTAVCTHFHEIEPRLARWLLMTQDLGICDKVHFTHKFLAQTLGVRRSGVTVAAGSLQRRGLIRYSRGNIMILDRAGLEAAACDCHQSLIDKYHLVFGSRGTLKSPAGQRF
ncbi:MAG: Crp/Fnr family transcriptional regulator [Pseudomonadales bacterium]